MKMKRFALLVMMLAAFGVAACDDDSPTEPDNNTVVFTANMSAAQEVPVVTNNESGATGNATITFNLTRNASNVITAATANFSATVANMPPGSNLIRAHIHTGAAGVPGGIVVDTGLLPASPIPIVNGQAALNISNGPAPDPATVQSIIDNPAGFYFNVHSTANPGGVVRGQLVRQ